MVCITNNNNSKSNTEQIQGNDGSQNASIKSYSQMDVFMDVRPKILIRGSIKSPAPTKQNNKTIAARNAWGSI